MGLLTKLKSFSTMRVSPLLVCAVLVITLGALVVYRSQIAWFGSRITKKVFPPTVENKMTIFGPIARARLVPIFEKQRIVYPPEKVLFLAIKSTNELLVYSASEDQKYKYICTYPILGASGHLGPKLREGDCQVPEGIYKLSLEPDTPYHLGLRLDYPNQTDLIHAKLEGRTKPGSDILIHGSTGSIGCLAMGDPASEDLFVLAADARNKEIPLIIAPVDLRNQAAPEATPDDPTWISELYDTIKNAMGALPKRPEG